MPILAAEIQFRKGLAALSENDAAAACGHFQAAVQTERQRGAVRPQMRYLSYYGLTLALSRGVSTEAIRACEVAARRDFFNADLLLNLGRVYQMAGKTTRALAAFERGLALAPAHAAIRDEIGKIDRRGAPPLSFVPRSHSLNKAFGRFLASMKFRRSRIPFTAPSDPFGRI